MLIIKKYKTFTNTGIIGNIFSHDLSHTVTNMFDKVKK